MTKGRFVVIISATVLISSLAYGAWFAFNVMSISDLKFFIADRKTVRLYSLSKGELFRKTIEPIDPLSYINKSNQQGANFSVQYDNKTQTVYYLTNPNNETSGDTCLNTDGSCTYRIYKVGLYGDTAASIIYESNTDIARWTVVPADNSILIADRKTLIKINASTGAIVYKNAFQFPLAHYFYDFGRFVLSPDGRFAYQSGRAYTPRALAVQTKAAIRIIDIANGDVRVIDNMYTGPITGDPEPSYDGKYVIFPTGSYNSPVVYLYDLQSRALREIAYAHTGPGELLWSPNSKVLAFSTSDKNNPLKEYIEYLNVDSSTTTVFSLSDRVWFGQWLDNQRILYITRDNDLRTVNLNDRRITPITPVSQFPLGSDIMGFSVLPLGSQ